MDVWVVVAKHVLGIPASDWAMVGRWLGHFHQGRFHHVDITKTTPVPGELVIGWIAHYMTGIGYAALIIMVYGLGWAREPTLGPALLVGVAMLMAPFLIMQPAMDAGIAAREPLDPMRRGCAA